MCKISSQFQSVSKVSVFKKKKKRFQCYIAFVYFQNNARWDSEDWVSIYGSFSNSCYGFGQVLSLSFFVYKVGLDGWRILCILSSSNSLRECPRYLVSSHGIWFLKNNCLP